MGARFDKIYWKPEFFIGTSYRTSIRNRGQYIKDDLTGLYTTDGLLEWGDLEQLGLQLARYTKSHFVLKIGTEGGRNPHGHAVAYSPDLTRWGREKVLFEPQRRHLWTKGRLWVKPYDLTKGKAGEHYTASHEHNPDLDRWTFCPRQRNACRKNRCPYERRRENTIGF